MIKYQATPLDILLVQQDGWNGENKVGCVRFTSPPALAFLLSTFSPSAKKCVLGQTWWISVRKKKKEDFTALRRKHIFLCLVPDAPVLPSLCVSALPPSLPLSFLLFYLRSLSEGLTISSGVSPLSCSAVYCLWFARAHPCGCSFRQPSVTRSNWGVGGWGGVHAASFAAPGPHSLFPHLRWAAHTHPHYLTLPGLVEPEPLFGCRRQLSFCAKKRRQGHRDITWEEEGR